MKRTNHIDLRVSEIINQYEPDGQILTQLFNGSLAALSWEEKSKDEKYEEKPLGSGYIFIAY